MSKQNCQSLNDKPSLSRARFVSLRNSFAALTIDELIEKLSSANLQTRFFAEMTLRDKTSV